MSVLVLKIIACIAMVIDHAAYVFEPQLTAVSPWLYVACRMIGRLAFPIFALGIAEGAVRTKSPKKYLRRMLVFAIIAQIPFSIMIGTHSPDLTFTLFGRTIGLFKEFSVMVTLFLGLCVCLAFEKKKYFLAAITLFAAIAADKAIGMDYGFLGVLFVFALYLTRTKGASRLVTVLLFALCLYITPLKTFAANIIFGRGLKITASILYCLATMAAGIPVLLYNGKLGKKCGVFFYTFYPVHMLVIWLVWLIFAK
jgi:hypothetical protein